MAHCVYVVRLQDRVIENPTFRKANPDYEEGRPCVYVGMTGRERDVRFRQHKEGYKSNRFVRDFGKRLFPWAWRDTGKYQTSDEAEAAEEALAEELRGRGWGVWQN